MSTFQTAILTWLVLLIALPVVGPPIIFLLVRWWNWCYEKILEGKI